MPSSVLRCASGTVLAALMALGCGAPAGSAPSGSGGEGNGRGFGGEGSKGLGGESSGGNSGGGSNGGSSGGASNSAGAGQNAKELAEKGLNTIAIDCDDPVVDSPAVICSLEVRDSAATQNYLDHAAVDLRGRSSLKFPKKNYSVELRTADDIENPTNLLGMGKESDWVLDGAWADRSFMRARLTFGLFRDMAPNQWAPRARYCELTFNGTYAGIYVLLEKIKRDDDRVDVANDDGTGSSFLVKQNEDGALRLTIGSGSKWEVIYPTASSITAAQTQAIQAWLDRLGAALRSSNPADLLGLLDAAAIIDWILLEEFAKNIDGYNLSLHFARSAGGLAWPIPWDFDLAFGQPTLRNATNESPQGWIYNRTTLISKLSAIATIRQGLGPRWRELRQGVFSNAAISARLDGYLAVLTPEAIAKNFALWPIQNVDFTAYYAPYSFYKVASFDEEVTHFRDWIEQRLAWLDANIDGYPAQ